MTVETQTVRKCPVCNSTLSGARGIEGLCPGCLIELALDSPSLMADFKGSDEAPTLQFSAGGFAEGRIQGDRYRIGSLLGRGGMGEVWRAYDLKLRLDVALKALRTELIADPQALEILRQEVRTAREVISPNVCRVYDLEELDGQELISMEYVDGTTLQEILKDRGPLELNEAREIASQFLAGLEAIHQAGLVHRDIKPENLMLTRTGRVVVMDFGIAKGLGDGKGGFVAGTPAYMSPEQAKGAELDARADLFSAGVVLAEMVEPRGLRSFEDRQRVWEGIHQESLQVSETPWTKVIMQTVAADRAERFATAFSLARALEEVTLRAAGDETARPYPGLSAFQEEDAEFFFGRELEVEALWKKLRRPHLLAVIGPSGAGKSSFLHAGLLPTLTDGWQAIFTTPGNRPFANLARALAEHLPGDSATVDALLRFEEAEIAVDLIAKWREQHNKGLIILDQFEELFTQNPEKVQQEYAALLGALPLGADVHVLLSMRDDFLIHCSNLESLAPVFSELSPLKSLSGASLRRALVEPALKCGYRFEDEEIVEEMLSEVEGQRGALPLLAFAAAQLWDRRDREKGLLSRKTYEQIGGVGGALAQHAEAILDYIGEPNVTIVRELFRNLVTAQGTRASRDREELLSVFPVTEGEPFLEPSKVRPTPIPKPRRPAALHVLNALIDARLLTSYEVPAADNDPTPHHRIEIVHESLLLNWPRLVRWQTQDAEGAQLRDELRHQARVWAEKDRPDDLLWTGTSYKEFELWRERYPGGLTVAEETFAAAMKAKAERRRRRVRTALAAVIVILLAVTGTIATLWRQSEVARDQAVQEGQRAEAAKLLALGQLELESDPTTALAYTIASLGLADSPATRRFALEVLWQGPTYFRLPPTGSPPHSVEFSPDERWLAVGFGGTGDLQIWSRDGGEPMVLLGKGGIASSLRFGPRSDVLVSGALMDVDNTTRVWSVPERELLLAAKGSSDPQWRTVAGVAPIYLSPDASELITMQSSLDWTRFRIQSWRADSEEPEELGIIEGVADTWATDASGKELYYWEDFTANEFLALPLDQLKTATPRVIAKYESDKQISVCTYRNGLTCGTSSSESTGGTGEIHLWALESGSLEPVRILETPAGVWGGISFGASRELLVAGHEEGIVGLWDLGGPPAADPLILRFESGNDVDGVALLPSGRWLAAANDDGGVRIFPLGRDYAKVFDTEGHYVAEVAFTPDGGSIVSMSVAGLFRWPLATSSGEEPRERLSVRGMFATDPDGRFLAQMQPRKQVTLIPLGDGESKAVPTPQQSARTLAVSHGGRLVAWGGSLSDQDRVIRVWDLDSGEVRVLDAGRDLGIEALEFTPDGSLLAAHVPPGTTMQGGSSRGALLRRWNLDDGSHEVVLEGVERFDLTRDGRYLLGFQDGSVIFHDLEQAQTTRLPGLGADGRTVSLALDPSGKIAVTGGEDGVIRVGPVTRGDPHLLMGHQSSVLSVEVSPDGHWIASGGADGTVRLWPMPEGPPFHTLPYNELLAKLESLTNLRVVRDQDSDTGWTVEIGPFPGWEEVPTW